MPMLV